MEMKMKMKRESFKIKFEKSYDFADCDYTLIVYTSKQLDSEELYIVAQLYLYNEMQEEIKDDYTIHECKDVKIECIEWNEKYEKEQFFEINIINKEKCDIYLRMNHEKFLIFSA